MVILPNGHTLIDWKHLIDLTLVILAVNQSSCLHTLHWSFVIYNLITIHNLITS